jgi:signal transduction histidine kinase
MKEGVNLLLDKVTGQINQEQEKILGIARGNIERLTRIINDLLDISKIEAGRIELKKDIIDIGDLIGQVVFSFGPKAKEKGLELRMNIPREKVEIYADKDKITQVLTNLIGNALKFSEKGYAEVSLRELEDKLECAVSDTGLGISSEDIPKVFDKFSQFGRSPGSGEKGTGLGLSIAKGIVEMHKGNIWFESELGKGSKFIFTLPKYHNETAQQMGVKRQTISS